MYRYYKLSIEFWSQTGYYYSISCREIKHGIYWGMVSLSRIIFYCKVRTQGFNYFQITGRARSVYSELRFPMCNYEKKV
jgi:hypothetical protein